MNKLNLFRYFKRYSFLYLIALLAMTAGTMLDQAAPLIVQHIIDDVLIAKRMEILNFLLLGILGIGVGRCIFQYTKEYACDYAGSKIASEVRINLFQKIQSLSANFFDGINSGELMSRVKDDVDRIWDIAAFMGILMAEVFIRTVTTIIFMVRINWQLALIPIVGMIGSGVIAIMMEKQLDDLYGAVMQEGSEMNNTAAENLAGVRTVKAFAREGFEIAKFHKHNQKFYELNIDLSRVFVKYNPMIQTITRLLSVISLLLGGLIVMKGNPLQGGAKMSVGELIAFTQYVGGMIWPMEMLGWLTNGFSSAKASVKRLNKIYAELPDITENSELAKNTQGDDAELADAMFSQFDIAGDISFEHVTYSPVVECSRSECIENTAESDNNVVSIRPSDYSTTGKAEPRKILDDVSFDIKAGQTLGIMGSTGSGKTTIINLLKRMYDVTDGSIKLDGIDIRELPLPTLRRAISCVMQDIFLFSDTIDGNIRLGARESITTAEVRSALNQSHASEFVDKMEEKENTVIGERGVGLSGGQKQRITIARALARKTPVLVLDDSTSALDTETEQEIQGVLAELSGMTKIIIAHRISAVRKADKIIVLDKGRVAECGTHEELLALGGLYKETYDSQY
ncbi:MAG: ABC transporter ATP-binding protein [Treponema sp.]|nr:ABC transporter ATP-binding protein/permease [Spirochaetia bacterium]MDD7533803.1 ABC transporter ATP-binding protein [Treponema sp.]MDY5758867.1 ABC transporter ATP-binding protein [Treponema sp.]